MRFRHFSFNEFSCRCRCYLGRINPLLVALLDKVRDELGQPIAVKSGVRCKQHNLNVGGIPSSMHVPDQFGVSHAADINCDDLDGLFALCKSNFLAVGDGRTRGFVHVDMRSDKIRGWGY